MPALKMVKSPALTEAKGYVLRFVVCKALDDCNHVTFDVVVIIVVVILDVDIDVVL